MEFYARVEYAYKPIRHIAIQCPECKKWFYGDDISDKKLEDEVDISFATFSCPLCKKEFGEIKHKDQVIIEEINYPDTYKECIKINK